MPETLTRRSLAFSYIIAAFKTAQCIVGNDAGKEFVCFLLTIPMFVGYYALFVLVCHGIKKGLYAYFKSHRKEWNSIADREEMEKHRYTTNAYRWEENRNDNLIGVDIETGETCFTWQPHGSQFTIHTRTPKNAIRFRIRRPPVLSMEATLKQINYSEDWIEIL